MNAVQEIERLEDKISQQQQEVDAEYLAFCIGLVEREDSEDSQFGVDSVRQEIQKAGKTMEDLKMDLKRLEYRKKTSLVDLERVRELRGGVPAIKESLAKMRADQKQRIKEINLEIVVMQDDINRVQEELMRNEREASELAASAHSGLQYTAIESEAPNAFLDWRNAKLVGAPGRDPDDPLSMLPRPY